jgi:hypothetical protein
MTSPAVVLSIADPTLGRALAQNLWHRFGTSTRCSTPPIRARRSHPSRTSWPADDASGWRRGPHDRSGRAAGNGCPDRCQAPGASARLSQAARVGRSRERREGRRER